MNVNPIAVSGSGIVLYWSGLIIALGIAAGFLLALSLYDAHYSGITGMLFFLPLAIVFSVLICRTMHWYCHEEQYGSLVQALTDFSGGSYCLQGALAGVFLAAFVTDLLGLVSHRDQILDAAAPGLALSVALIRLSSMFNNTCHSKYVIVQQKFMRLPFGAQIPGASTADDWRFATFFVEFLLMLAVTFILIACYYRLRNCPMKATCRRGGHVFRVFLVLFCGIELVLDSTRNDSSFLHFPGTLKLLNKFAGFVSVAQLISAILILAVLIYYTRRSKKAGTSGGKIFLIWFLYVLSLATVGVCEYCVQRWSNLFRILYAVMSCGAVLMMLSVFFMLRTCVGKKTGEAE